MNFLGIFLTLLWCLKYFCLSHPCCWSWMFFHSIHDTLRAFPFSLWICSFVMHVPHLLNRFTFGIETCWKCSLHMLQNLVYPRRLLSLWRVFLSSWYILYSLSKSNKMAGAFSVHWAYCWSLFWQFLKPCFGWQRDFWFSIVTWPCTCHCCSSILEFLLEVKEPSNNGAIIFSSKLLGKQFYHSLCIHRRTFHNP